MIFCVFIDKLYCVSRIQLTGVSYFTSSMSIFARYLQTLSIAFYSIAQILISNIFFEFDYIQQKIFDITGLQIAKL